MKWLIAILLIISSCSPKIMKEIERIAIRDTIYINSEIFNSYIHDTLYFESYQDREPLMKKVQVSPIQKSKETKIVQVVKTVYGDPGTLVYDIPDSMRIGQIYTIRVRIQTGKSKIDNTGLSNPAGFQIRTSRRMSVDLSDPDPNISFKISKINSDQQFIEKENFTEWIFKVSPTRSGKKNLNLVVSIISDEGVKQIVYEDFVEVSNSIPVKIKSFWEENWQWLFSSMLIPIFIYLWGKRKKDTSKN